MLRLLLYLIPLLPLALGKASLGPRQDTDPNGHDDDPRRQRRRALQRVTAQGDFIYFIGGRISTFVDGEKILKYTDSDPSVPLNSTMVIPHDKDWKIADLVFEFLEDDPPPPVNDPAVWHDMQENRLYRWAGSRGKRDYLPDKDGKLWEFKIDDNGGGTWGKVKPGNREVFDDILGSIHGGSTSCDRKGFLIGGYGRRATDNRLEEYVGGSSRPVTGILTYDMETRKWSNDSTEPMSPPHGTVINSAAACVQGFAFDPLILSLAGARTSPTDADKKLSLLAMDNITFWDPDSGSWHWQTATGDEVPDGRENPCVAGAWSSKDGNYDIFMYGGKKSYESVDDIYILSLPGFRWFKVDAAGSRPRMHHSCARVGKRQMLSTGGLWKEWDYKSMDPWLHSLGILDMTELEWRDGFNASADDYESPQMVKEWYSNGGMESVEWSSDDVKAMFAKDDGETSSGANEDSDSAGDSESSKSDTGAIAGGVVGGVAGLALAGALVWFILRRRQRQRPQDKPDYPHHELHGASALIHEAHGSELKSSPGPVEMPTDEHERLELAGWARRAEMQG